MAQPPPPPYGQPPGPPFVQPGYGQPPPPSPPPVTKAKRRSQGMTRPQGALLLAIGLGLGAFNVYSLQHDGKYYPKAMLITPISILVGVFAIAVGAPKDPQTGLLPLWVRIGYGATGILGLGLGILALVFVGC